MVFAYFTPDVTFPLASALAAVVGFFVLVGRAPLRYAGKVFRCLAAPLRRAGVRSRPGGAKVRQ
jgi:hypothetical protein